MKIGLVCYSGGHLYQLHILEEFWGKHDRFWVTFKKADALSLLKNERTYWAYHPATRNILNLVRNSFLAWKILRRERPDVIVSTGAAVAVPFFYLAKLFRIKTVFIEVYDRIDRPTLTGRLVYPVADAFVTQWPEQKKAFPRGIHIGQIL
ncbi:MAG: UDP-N-acetylglucosamine--LPS N-acetylglucosamine transferase [Acidobacteria bacterium]|nr:UDP-N-acetylglucosamine--LPS N-acetylglucosamine transferase [Acidobacteriota bacterium]